MLTTSHLRRVDAVVSGGTVVKVYADRELLQQEVVLNITNV